MAAVRSAAFGCCVLSTVAGLVRIFWPENGFKPVINAVLALYIITAAVQIIRVADWAGIAAELAPASDSSSVSDSEVGAYRRTLTDEAAAQALRDVLAASGIEAGHCPHGYRLAGHAGACGGRPKGRSPACGQLRHDPL